VSSLGKLWPYPNGQGEDVFPILTQLCNELDFDPEMPFRVWYPLGYETRSRAKVRLMRALEGLVSEHLNRMEALARQIGAVPTPEKRARQGGRKGARPRGSADLHYEWVARWQVPRAPGEPPETLQEIAERPSVNSDPPSPRVEPRTVQKAIKRAAVEIGLARR
jgi:hypothetical protein